MQNTIHNNWVDADPPSEPDPWEQFAHPQFTPNDDLDELQDEDPRDTQELVSLIATGNKRRLRQPRIILIPRLWEVLGQAAVMIVIGAAALGLLLLAVVVIGAVVSVVIALTNAIIGIVCVLLLVALIIGAASAN